MSRLVCPNACGVDSWSQVELDSHLAKHCPNSPLVDRRQRAREAFWDAGDESPESLPPALEATIETATRARIMDEALALAVGASRDHFRTPGAYATTGVLAQLRANLAAALTELGFEVEQ